MWSSKRQSAPYVPVGFVKKAILRPNKPQENRDRVLCLGVSCAACSVGITRGDLSGTCPFSRGAPEQINTCAPRMKFTRISLCLSKYPHVPTVGLASMPLGQRGPLTHPSARERHLPTASRRPPLLSLTSSSHLPLAVCTSARGALQRPERRGAVKRSRDNSEFTPLASRVRRRQRVCRWRSVNERPAARSCLPV